MHSYAQTNIQLFNQMRSEGYSQQDIEQVGKVYEFAMELFTGLFMPSGKTFISHLVGTASILASLHVPVSVVSAGLIHAAYLYGNFGGAKEGITEIKRSYVKDAVGTEIEEYVEKYERMVWSPKNILLLRDALDELNPIDRYVLLMNLANELEHNLDLGALYFPDRDNWYRRHIERYGPIMMEMADRLGVPSLTDGMATAFVNLASAAIPVQPRMSGAHDGAYLVVPKSYRQQFGVVSYQKLLQAQVFFCEIMNKLKRRYRQLSSD